MSEKVFLTKDDAKVRKLYKWGFTDTLVIVITGMNTLT